MLIYLGRPSQRPHVFLHKKQWRQEGLNTHSMVMIIFSVGQEHIYQPEDLQLYLQPQLLASADVGSYAPFADL